MKPETVSLHQLLLNAQQAMQRGDRQTARRLAEKAAALAPDREEPWLLLASLASPHASVSYLERALQINPRSQQARQGMHWAVERLRHGDSTSPVKNSPSSALPTRSGRRADSEPKTQPRGKAPLPSTVARSAPVSIRSLSKYRWSFLTLTLVVVCVGVALTFWNGNASPALAFLHGSQPTQGLPGILASVDKPTYTPTFTSTYTPTDTYTPSPTFTLTPSVTNTPIPTDTPLPTDTLLPTDILWPTFTPVPWPTDTPQPMADVSGGGGVRWIDVDLSQQMLYAYEGSTIVASFLVSTGVPAFPTVTGQYHIYVKYVYTDMSGPGYYLPNVPYTMYFYKGYGIHGTYWHHNFGHPMSHGCVNMYTPDAEWMFYWASVGTLVNIHY